MYKRLILTVALFASLTITTSHRPNPLSSLYISEISPEGWINLTNISDEYIKLIGWYINEEALPDIEIPPNSITRIYIENLGYRNNTLYLYDNEGYVADIFSSGTLRPGLTAVRSDDNTRLISNTAGQTFVGYALPVYASIDDIFIEQGTAVYLHTNDPNGIIYFTLNGNTPTQSSRIYSEPIIINSNTVLRACVFSPDRLPSRTLSRTYLVDITHSLPVVALVSDHDGLFSEGRGIFMDGPNIDLSSPMFAGANWWNRWERETHFGFYEYGDLRVETDASIRIHGAFSRRHAQKNIAVHFRTRHGVGTIAYPLIPHIDRHEFDSLILRAAGQDWARARLRDAFIHNAVIEDTHVTGYAASPVVVYINGRFWGHYNLRERLNADFFEIHHGIPKDEIDIIRHNNRVVAGSFTAKRQLLDTLRDITNMNTPEALEYVQANIDLDNWIDYWIIITFFMNDDTGNIRFYRPRTEDGKWRWILWDQDWALLMQRFNPFSNMLNPVGHGAGNNFSTTVARRLMENDYIRNRFLERYAYLLSDILHPDRLIPILNEYAALMEPEMPLQIARWNSPVSMNTWYGQLNVIRNFLTQREARMLEYIRSTFRLSNSQMYELFGI